MVTVHLVRDGRDMAYSKTSSRLEADGGPLIARTSTRAPGPVAPIALWSRINLVAAPTGRLDGWTRIW